MKASDLTDKIVYHGDNFGTTVLQPKYMMHSASNNQEGVGIYFTPDINVALTYGPKISKISIANLNIKNSRATVKNTIPKANALKLLQYLHTVNNEFWYHISDYAEVSDRNMVRNQHFNTMLASAGEQELRNWQIELAQASTPTDLISGWNKYIKISGLYEPVSQFYSIIDTSVVATPVNWQSEQ